MLTATALFCMAANVYFEARGLSVVDQKAVATVTMNRAKWQPENVCDEVFKPKQFSWTNDGAARLHKGRIILAEHRKIREPEAWGTALHVAKLALAGKTKGMTGGATHYHHVSVLPKWATHPRMQPLRSFGPHVFYRDKQVTGDYTVNLKLRSTQRVVRVEFEPEPETGVIDWLKGLLGKRQASGVKIGQSLVIHD